MGSGLSAWAQGHLRRIQHLDALRADIVEARNRILEYDSADCDDRGALRADLVRYDSLVSSFNAIKYWFMERYAPVNSMHFANNVRGDLYRFGIYHGQECSHAVR